MESEVYNLLIIPKQVFRKIKQNKKHIEGIPGKSENDENNPEFAIVPKSKRLRV